MAAYQSEVYAKMSIISVIRLLAVKLELIVQFTSMEDMTYGDLSNLRDDLLARYNDKFFEANCAKELGFK